MTSDLRVIVANAAKSNGTVLCLAGKSIVMGASSELGPIEPQVNQIPTTFLNTPMLATQNPVLYQAAQFAIQQTRKLATRLLKKGMMSLKPEQEIAASVEKLLTRTVYPSHGSVIDYKEAAALGLTVEYLPPEDTNWRRFRLLACMYESDCRKNRYLKIFEGERRSSAIQAPTVTPLAPQVPPRLAPRIQP
jgi:hypothetical protein